MIKIKKLLKKETYSKITLKYILFINILVWLSCPIWHNFIFIFDFQDIEGLDKKSEPANFNFKNWISADYQLSVEKYLINHNPISPFFVRLKNQIDYSLFEEINISNGIVCKDFYLFQKDYIDAYVGTDFIGKESLRAYVEKMKFVQDTLQRLHKEFIYVQAPDKATFYPEFLPDSIQQKVTNQTNYNELNKLIVEYKINYIDFVPYFLKAKKTSEYPLFTQTGIHWSIYSTVLVMDSLNRYIERNMNIDIPNIYYDDIEVGYARLGDADLEGMSNYCLRLVILNMDTQITNLNQEKIKMLRMLR
jgi:hypothetical protein